MKKFVYCITNVIRFVRAIYWKMKFKSCGKNFLCCSGSIIRGAKKVSVGNNVRIGEGSYINARGGLKIGNNVQLGPKVFIWTSNHNYYEPIMLPYDEEEILEPVTIEDNVWLGAKSSIIPGITIGEGAVVAMCAVVTKDVPPCAVVGGNPAKILKYRNVEHYNKLKENMNTTSK